MKNLFCAIVFAVTLGAVTGASAQIYPTRPITIVVPYPAGGAVDALGRILAESMTATLGQSVVIENAGGAGGSIGVGRVARAAADGYTISVATGDQYVANGAIYPLQYDVVKDFEPVVLLASSPFLIVTKNAVPAKDMKELIVWLKANQDKVTQGHNGAGNGQHLCGLDLQKRLGAKWPFVPYRGAAPALQDLVSGQYDVYCPLPGSALGLVRGGKIRVYAVASSTRLTSAPEIPTVDEAGLPGFYNSIWTGMWAPKGTPRDVIARLNAAVVKAFSDPAVRKRITDIGMEAPPRDRLTPEALGAYQKAEIEKWWPIIKGEGIKAE